MGKAGKRQHQKRGSAPKTWPVNRKGTVWVPKISPGPHNKNMAMPLTVLLRDVLGLAQTKNEVKRILSARRVKIDGRIIVDENFPVGLMDVIEFDGLDEAYRIHLHTSNTLLPFPIDEDRRSFKICRVIGKRNVKGGDTQISLHDGRNILLEKGDDKIDQIKGHYSLKIEVPSQEILEIYPLDEGSRALVTEGRHQGKIGKIMEINKRFGPKASEVIFEDEYEEENPLFRTALDYVFVVGPELELQR